MPNAAQFSKMRLEYLKELFPKVYRHMEKQGTLAQHLSQVGQEADEMWRDLEAQMLTAPDLPENYLDRVARLESIPEIVRELVTRELIYVPPPQSRRQIG